MERILDDIRDSVTNTIRRKHLIRRQDLHNIKAQYNIDGIMRHKNDLTSVLAWVEEMNALEYNPVFKQMLTEFFRVIEQRAGKINPQWFMTDDAEQFYNAWIEVFGEQDIKKILCTWHVDRAWRKALHQHIHETEKRIEIYHQLRVLLMESEFRVMLQEFITYTERYHYQFYIYFNTHYCRRVHQWASCYRLHTAVNTNMFVEAFHRVLKVIYLHHKVNRRIDILFITLLKLSRDKAFERFHKMETGKLSHRVCEINRRHKAAEQIQQNNQCHITTVQLNTEWTVQSISMTNTYHTVKRQMDSCNCHLICKSCRVCTHQFTCTCLDSTLRLTVCKHIHLVVIAEITPSKLTCRRRSTSPTASIHSKFAGILRMQNSNDKELLAVKDTVQSMMCELQVLTHNCRDIHAMNILKLRLQAVIAVIKAILKTPKTEATLTPKTQYAPNSNHSKQITFYSTRKRRRAESSSLSKPSVTQVADQRKRLKEEEPKFCGICLQQNDASSTTTIDWIQCSLCAMWIHVACNTVPLSLNGSDDDDYICPYCPT